MSVLCGVILVVLSSLSWGGQALSLLAPDRAVRWKLMEAEDDVEPTFWADVRAEALWDTFTLWTMVVAGVLLIAGHAAWPYFGLIAGGMYLYFAGRGVATRLEMRHRGMRIGTPANVRIGLIALAVWGAMAAAMIVASAVELAGR